MSAAKATRVDIQALRGIAVLLVVLQHAQLLPFLRAGYLGVDVFFVISGYMVTRMILDSLAQGDFSFKSFYVRRAQRLLPAAYATLAATTIASTFFLTTPELRELAWQQLGALTFVANIVLWSQTGYFETLAQLKPLLHFWSLSIEEQYYLLLPAGLVLVGPTFRGRAVAIATVLSLGLAIAFASAKPSASFYLLPFRAWELGLGTLVALGVLSKLPKVLLSVLSVPAVISLLALPFWPTGFPHPGFDALLVCLGTAVLIERAHPDAARLAPVRVLAGFGDISYSLYLVHWPVFAFAACARVLTISPWSLRCALASAAILGALALHLGVEQRYRHRKIQNELHALLLALGATAALALTPFAIVAVQAAADPLDTEKALRVNLGLSNTCVYGDRFERRNECARGLAPRVFLWGDSFSMHLADAFEVSASNGFVQASKLTCGPILDVSPDFSEPASGRPLAAACISFNDSVLAYLASEPSIEVVVLSSMLSQYLGSGDVFVRRPFGSPNASFAAEQRSSELLTAAMARTVVALRAMGKKVVLAAPPPSPNTFNIGRCLALRASGKFHYGAPRPDCSYTEAEFRDIQRHVLELMDRMGRAADLPIVGFDKFLCKSGVCAVEGDGVFLYLDGIHFTHEGSRWIGQQMGLADRLAREAR